ncbi:MAG: succinate dehydrogenase, cytochrome b556 subunit [Acetobacteraceae bacterium]|nr:succinate dehydrogenase, cytochrome b556 subunit [Acetobacteraceae bacterium]
MGRRSDGKLVERPLSPHLQVYKWPVSMALSISHRATGVGLSVGALLMTWWLVAAASSDSAFATVQGFLGSWFGVFLLFCWAAALLLHLFQGIRHLVWDAGYGFDNRSYRVTGWGVLAATVVATLIVWIVGLVVW